MTNFTNKVLYIGVTNDLERRVGEHKAGSYKGFTQTYRINKLVYFESGDYGLAALAREKQLKGWTRAKKIKLIESMNPDWHDLALEIFTRRANWAKLVQEQNGSGLNAAACCRQKELNEKAFRLLDCAGLQTEHTRLIPVHFVAGTGRALMAVCCYL